MNSEPYLINQLQAMKNKLTLLTGCIALLLFTRCSVQKDYQGKITKDFTAIAGASGKLKNDSLFRKTTVTLSTYSEFISLYNLQKAPKPIAGKYAGSFGNYAEILDTLTREVQNNKPGYEDKYSKTMNYIMADVKDKYVSLNPKSQVQQYHPVLVDVKLTVTDKNGKELTGYQAFMEPALAYKQVQSISFTKPAEVKKGIVPGYYKIRVEKDGKTLSEKNEHIKNQIETVNIHLQI